MPQNGHLSDLKRIFLETRFVFAPSSLLSAAVMKILDRLHNAQHAEPRFSHWLFDSPIVLEVGPRQSSRSQTALGRVFLGEANSTREHIVSIF